MSPLIKNFLSFFFLLNLFSCVFLDGQDATQVYPDYEYRVLEEILFYDMKTNQQILINDFATIESAKEFFLDKENYFKDELIKFNGVKPNYSLTLISALDTLILKAYPTMKKDRIEFDFTEKYDPEHPMKSRRVHRFYIKAELVGLLGINPSVP